VLVAGGALYIIASIAVFRACVRSGLPWDDLIGLIMIGVMLGLGAFCCLVSALVFGQSDTAAGVIGIGVTSFLVAIPLCIIGCTTNFRRLPTKMRFAPSVRTFSHLAYTDAKSGRYTGNVLPVRIAGSQLTPVYERVDRLDDVFFSLPPEHRPRVPKDIESVALLDYELIAVGQYMRKGERARFQPPGQYNNDGATWAYRIQCKITVIDLKTKAKVTQTTVFGRDPPAEIATGSPSGANYVCGPVPSQEIITFLVGLMGSQTKNAR